MNLVHLAHGKPPSRDKSVPLQQKDDNTCFMFILFIWTACVSFRVTVLGSTDKARSAWMTWMSICQMTFSKKTVASLCVTISNSINGTKGCEVNCSYSLTTKLTITGFGLCCWKVVSFIWRYLSGANLSHTLLRCNELKKHLSVWLLFVNSSFVVKVTLTTIKSRLSHMRRDTRAQIWS